MCWSGVDRSHGTYRYDDRHSTPADTPPSGEFRVSDRERQDVIDQLRHHTGEGRLSLDEFESRLDDVLQAKTGNDLQNALRELPPSEPRRSLAGPSLTRIPLPVLICAVVLVVSLAAGHALFWLFIPCFFFWTSGRRRHHARSHGADRSNDSDRRDEVLTSA